MEAKTGESWEALLSSKRLQAGDLLAVLLWLLLCGRLQRKVAHQGDVVRGPGGRGQRAVQRLERRRLQVG